MITLLDVFSRYALEWVLAYDMKTKRVITLIDKLIHQWIPVDGGGIKVILRSDNGPQFIAKLLKEKLEQEKIDHEFIQPGTPQQNGHIESFHATVQKLVCDKYPFDNLQDAQQVIGRFMYTYNNIRNMKAILSKPPAGFLRLWSDGMVGIKLYKDKQTYYLKERPKPMESALPLEALALKTKFNEPNNLFLNQL